MRAILYTAFAAILLVIVYAFSSPKSAVETDVRRGIKFHKGTWEEALEQAKKEDKIIFLDVYATWCKPCKLMKRKTFSDKEVGAFYNKNFINVRFDGEKKEGAILTRKYRVSGYPSLLFIDKNGNLLGKTTGFRKPYHFINLGKRYLPE